jgi:hypothetical protein
LFEESLEVKLSTILTDEATKDARVREGKERRKNIEEKESAERRCRFAKR